MACKICDSERLGRARIGSAELTRCNDCTAAYLSAMPGERELSSYYESSYRLVSSDQKYAPEARRWSRLPEQLKYISAIEKLMHGPARILDCGCDRGYFLDEARRHGHSVFGLEPSLAARRYCDEIGIRTFSSLDQASCEVDVVTMWHSLEHVTEPVEYMGKVAGRLADGGHLLVRVPDYGSFWARTMGKRWIWFQPANHYFYYSKTSLSKLLERVGFEVIHVRSQRANTLLTGAFGLASRRAFGKHFGFKRGIREVVRDLYEAVVGIEVLAIARRASNRA